MWAFPAWRTAIFCGCGQVRETMRAQQLILKKMKSPTPDTEAHLRLLGGDSMASTASEGPAFGLGLGAWGGVGAPGARSRPIVPALAA